MRTIQLDDRALLLERWKDLLVLELNRAPKTSEHAKIEKALADWNGPRVDRFGLVPVRQGVAQ